MPVISGVRIPVKLPWKGLTNNEEQFVSMKKPVADFLKLSAVSDNELKYDTVVRYKKRDKDGNPTGDYIEKRVKRIRKPGYRTRSVRIHFGDNQGKKQKKAIPGAKSVYSLQFPITTSISISEVVESFKSGQYAKLGVIRVVDANSGEGYPTL